MEVFHGVSFLFFPMSIDNNIWYARVGIFNCQIRYVFPSVRHCGDINFFINLLNKTKSYSALLLSFLIFCLGVTVFFCLSIFHLLFFFIKTDSLLILPMKHPSKFLYIVYRVSLLLLFVLAVFGINFIDLIRC